LQREKSKRLTTSNPPTNARSSISGFTPALGVIDSQEVLSDEEESDSIKQTKKKAVKKKKRTKSKGSVANFKNLMNTSGPNDDLELTSKSLLSEKKEFYHPV
jgi:hypothetical protein